MRELILDYQDNIFEYCGAFVVFFGDVFLTITTLNFTFSIYLLYEWALAVFRVN
ncbi:MAG: hypothetical protein LC127_03250 [Chitinophagales bacterium]|nr:hypothetical protein [Chitinophagales bacterium]